MQMREESYLLHSVDPDAMRYILGKIQKSFNIKLDNEDLKDVDTFGNLCDLVISTIDHSNTCNAQQAFYKVRRAIVGVTGIDKSSIRPQTRLSSILNEENRVQVLSQIEHELGFQINLLQPKQWMIALFVFTFVCSVIGCFYNITIGVAGVLSSVISLKFVGNFGKEIHLKTVGDLASKISRELYPKPSGNYHTVKKSEIEQKVKDLFMSELGLEPVVLSNKSVF
ncbi:MAG: hypothetical protein JO080_00860 [Mucilaginibacter sp.]|nr:hypothetical protein [Mucilaginibacter sp.]